jgi:voltage-gated potassium channel
MWGDALVVILAVVSVLLQIYKSVYRGVMSEQQRDLFFLGEVIFTLAYACEFGLRIWLADNWRAYVSSFYGIMDILCFLPMLIETVIKIYHVIPTGSTANISLIFLMLRVFKLVSGSETEGH